MYLCGVERFNDRPGVFPATLTFIIMAKVINGVEDLSATAINKMYSFRDWADDMAGKCPEDGEDLRCGINLHWLFSQISASIECILQDL